MRGCVLPPHLQASSVMSGTGSRTDREEDYRFLHSMLMEKKLHLLFKIHERLRRFEKRSPVPVQHNAASLASDVSDSVQTSFCRADTVLLSSSQSLLSVHDAVAQRDFEPTLPPIPDDVPDEEEDSVKIVSLVKTKEPLGATLKKDKSTGAIVVARILRGGAADKSGLIHEGDELKEVNGVSLEHRKPKEILPLLARSESEIKFTIIPASYKEDMSSSKKLFVRALFDYDPNEDPTVPCKDAAVAFQRGDILQIVSTEDDTWWQACHLRDGNARAGLIPSQQLHERRVALQRPKALFKPRRVKPPVMHPQIIEGLLPLLAGLRRSFRLGRKSSLDREASWSRRWSTGVHGSVCPPTYIEVMPYCRSPKDRHRLVVLVGPSGVGVNELKRRLLISDPDRYSVTIPHTTRAKTRQEIEGVDYHFVSIHIFEKEYGRYKGHYYGTSLDSVHQVLAEGKVCLLDVHPSKITHVYTSEFKPYVVFVKPPPIEELRLTRRRSKFTSDERDTNPVRIFSDEDFENMIDLAETMENQYGHLFDKVVVNGDIAVAFRELKADLKKTQEKDIQWIPAQWIYSPSTKERRSCSHVTGWI
uniref:Membrane protein, palmitoylated 7b (MAGUK p55 subfamily member 7) n=1 Tax=Anabas testudineus TaxID=64144 RepID=A0A3Q1H6X3_ANATE